MSRRRPGRCVGEKSIFIVPRIEPRFLGFHITKPSNLTPDFICYVGVKHGFLLCNNHTGKGV